MKTTLMTKTNLIGRKILQINFWLELFKLEKKILYKILEFKFISFYFLFYIIHVCTLFSLKKKKIK
jgi:hypothetical protein